MIMDKRLEFADAVGVDGSTGTANIGSQIDMSVVRDLGAGQPVLYLVITVDTEIITAGSAGTIQFKLVSDDSASIATDGSASEHWASKSYVTDDAAANDAALNAGTMLAAIALPMEGVAYERYLGVQAVRGSQAVTAGKINAFLTFQPPKWKALADGI